jgi:hypothetical protein
VTVLHVGLRCGNSDLLAGLSGPRETDAAYVHVPSQGCASCVALAGDDDDDARGKASSLDELCGEDRLAGS